MLFVCLFVADLGRGGVNRERVCRAVAGLAGWVTVVTQTRIQQKGRVRLVRLLGGLYKLGALLLRDLVRVGTSLPPQPPQPQPPSPPSPPKGVRDGWAEAGAMMAMPSGRAVRAVVEGIGGGMDAHTAFVGSYTQSGGGSTRSRIAADSRAVPQLFYAAEVFRGEVLKAGKRLGKAYDFVDSLPRSKARDFRVTWKELDRRIAEQDEDDAEGEERGERRKAARAAEGSGNNSNNNNNDSE